MEAISHAGTALGILAKDGILLAAEKKTTSKLLESLSREKIYQIDEYVLFYVGEEFGRLKHVCCY